MSNSVFPSLPGLTWDVKMRPRFDTNVQTAKSGKELRAQFMAYPLWEFELNYEFLRQQAAFQELQTLVGFYLSRQGRFDSFLYNNPVDSAVTAQQFGVGDAATVAFQLVRAFGGFLEPVQNLNGAPSIFVNDWEGNQLQYATPRTNLCWWNRQLDNAAWTLTRATVTANAVAGPDGSVTAEKLVEDITATNSHMIATPGWTSTLVPYTFWVDAKAAERTRFQLGISTAHITGTGANGAFNLGAGTAAVVNNCTVSITPLPLSGWYRCGITFTPTAAAAASSFINLADASGNVSYTGDGASGMYFTNPQIELGSVSTSSILTVGANASATDYALGSTGLATMSPAPLLGALLTWTGSYYYRVRFSDDLSEFDNFLSNLWSNSKLGFVSVKL